MSNHQDELNERAQDLYAEFRVRQDGGETVDLEGFIGENPMHADALRRIDRDMRKMDRIQGALGGAASPGPFFDETLEGPDGSRSGRRSDPQSARESAKDPGSETPSEPEALVDAIGRRGNPWSRYRVDQMIGKGSMGQVYKVHDQDLRRILAMKLLTLPPPGVFKDETRRKLDRFVAEAQVASQLDHPGVAPVHDLGVAPDGRIYFTMKLVKGRELLEVIDEMHAARDADLSTDWTPKRIASLCVKICETMSYAHFKGLLHRDLKPSNIMVGRYGAVYVMDWGLARIFTAGRRDVLLPDGNITLNVESERQARGFGTTIHSKSDETRVGQTIGTPAYMAPEQSAGEVPIDPRADVYSIGAILYHALAGHAPYTSPGKRSTAEAVLVKLDQGPPPSIDEVAPSAPAGLRNIVKRAMERDREDRFLSMEAMGDALASYIEGPTETRKADVSGELPIQILGAIAALAGAVAGALLTWLLL